MSLIVTCKKCGQGFSVGPNLYGRRAACPKCKAILNIPNPYGSAATPASSQPPVPSPTRSRNRAFLLGLAIVGTVFVLGLVAFVVIQFVLSNSDSDEQASRTVESKSSNLLLGDLSQLTERQKEIARLLPVDVREVSALGPKSFPARLEEIARRYYKALQSDPIWFAEYRRINSAPLPWHPKMEITESEHVELQEFIENYELTEVERLPIDVALRDQFSIEFKAQGQIAALNGVRIEIDSETLVTPFGVVKNPAPMASEEGSKVGPVRGYEWRHIADRKARDSISIDFVIARRTDNQRRILRYKVTRISGGKITESHDIMIVY
jgi:hypothetical protein